MPIDKPPRRMTLRQLMTHSEKCARDLAEHLQASLLPCVSEYRDLSRPVRRKSHYPTLVALANALKKMEQAGEESRALADYLQENLKEIHEHARRERINRR
jgi:hypothetical protein